MNKKDLLHLLTGIKAGKVNLQDAITKAESTRGTLPWESVDIENDFQFELGHLYKVDSEDGNVVKLKYDIPGKRLSVALPNEKKEAVKA